MFRSIGLWLLIGLGATVWLAWPTIHLIDKQGVVRYRHIGEGAYRETESVIRQLLDDPS